MKTAFFRRATSLALGLVWASAAVAQVSDIQTQNFGILGNRPYTELTRTNRMKDVREVRGTFYWRPQWIPSDFFFNDGSRINQVLTKLYLLEETSVVAKRPEGDSIIIAMDRIHSVRLLDPLTGDSVVFQRIVHQEKVRGEVMQVLCSGTFTLLRRHLVNFMPADPPRAMNTGRVYDEYVPKSELFLLKKGYPVLQRVRANKKAILEILTGQDAKMLDFLAKQKLDLGKDQDLARWVAFYNSWY